ncbi:hypothetical protein IFR05_001522 [Cadophora sp. M221]|nr:hypothetical protein IFR05_001522 [Cadophora sp. M221]
MGALTSENAHIYYSGDEESDSELDLTSDEAFARQMNAIQTKDGISESESDSDEDYGPKYSASGRLKKQKAYRDSVKSLKLVPRKFIGCDINILDNLSIKGWEKFKRELKRLGIGLVFDRPSVLPIRGMTLEQQQWLSVVEIYTRCALTFAKDKLVAISGMARELSKDMDCEYLAGLWRRDLEHQILWKVKGAHPATKKEDMRGPSWSWASVVGEIEIPDWRGYFYDAIPGDITWFSKVDLARVCLAGTDEFGQVRSGVLHITGPLSVVRIDKESSHNPDAGDEDLILLKIQANILWDTKEVEETFGKSHRNTNKRRYSRYDTKKRASEEVNPLDVFYLPVRIMEAADPCSNFSERPVLTGLLLLPTGQKG